MRFFLFSGILISSLWVGCSGQNVRSEAYFEQAESAYQAGQYEIAHQSYTIFLHQNPDPQLARLAERRILSIEREIETVMGQKSGPRPTYVQHEDTNEARPIQHPNVLTGRSSRLPRYE